MKNKQRLISLLLCMMMVLGMLAAPGFADGPETHDHEEEPEITVTDAVVIDETSKTWTEEVPSADDADAPETTEDIGSNAAEATSEPVQEPLVSSSSPMMPMSSLDVPSPLALEEVDLEAVKSDINSYLETADVDVTSHQDTYSDTYTFSQDADGVDSQVALIAALKGGVDTLLAQVKEDGYAITSASAAVEETHDSGDAYKLTIQYNKKDVGAPVITVEAVDGNKDTLYDTDYYCSIPTIKVTDNVGIQKISIENKFRDEWYSDEETENWNEDLEGTPTEHSIDLSGKKGTFTITVTDTSENTASVSFHVEHVTGTMQRADYPPSCTEPSRMLTLYYCRTCNELFYTITNKYQPGNNEYRAPLGHDYGNETYEVEDPCGPTDEKATYQICERCGYVNVLSGDFDIEDSSHSWTTKTKEATCENQGATWEECELCGARKNVVNTPAHGHLYGEYKDTVYPDCKTKTNGTRETHCRYESEGCEHPVKTITIPYSHKYRDAVIEEATCVKEGKGGNVCSVCGNISEYGQYTIPTGDHQFPPVSDDCTKERKCLNCEETIPGEEHHNLEWRDYSNKMHYAVCTNPGCTFKSDNTEHTRPENYDCTKAYYCETCGGYVPASNVTHEFPAEWESDGTNHWKKCIHPDCTYTGKSAAHIVENDNDCTTDDLCSVCRAVVHEGLDEHNYGDTLYSGSAGHWKECENPDCNATSEVQPHTAVNDNNCTTEDKCPECDYVVRPKQESHSFAGAPYESAGAEGHHQKCQNQGCNEYNNIVEHSGGKATCVTPAVCDDCNASYGGVDASEHEGPIVTEKRVPATTETEGYSGDEVCQSCHVVVKKGEVIPKQGPTHQHSFTIPMEDDEACWMQCECGERDDYRPHDFEQKSDANGHWNECKNCHHQTEHLPHVGDDDNDCETALTCDTCGYEMKAALHHVWSEEYAGNPSSHWHTCTNPGCTATSDPEDHDAEDDGNCETALVCKTCQRIIREAETHKFGSVWNISAEGHYTLCQNTGCNERHVEEHIASTDDGNCATAVTCTVCTYEMVPAQEHSFIGSPWYSDGQGHHYRECTNPGCDEESMIEACSGGTATCISQAICEHCNQPYGETNPDNHIEGVVLKDYVEPTFETEGYSGDEHCAGCDTIVKHGEVLARLEEEHFHNYTVDMADTEACWKQCECGAIDPDSWKPHVFEGDYLYDDTGHYRLCANGCGTKSAVIPHEAGENDYNCETALTCKDCDYEFVPAQTHRFDTSAYSHDATGHWNVCLNDNCTVQGNKTEHDAEDDGNCETALVCDTCGYVIDAELLHSFSGNWTTDGTEHWKVCENPGCKAEDARAAHEGGDATCIRQAACDVCGELYGSVDPDNHKGATERRNHRPATAEEDGYTGDIYCLDCEEIIENGTTIPAVGEDHEHTFGAWEGDATHHWRECETCGYDDGYGEHDENILDSNETHHWTSCSVCGKKNPEMPHNTNAMGSDENEHWTECDVCGKEGEHEAHQMDSMGHSSTEHWNVCALCGKESEHEAHDQKEMKHDETSHWNVCSVCGEQSSISEKHTFVDGECTVCKALDPSYVPPVEPGDADLTALRAAIAAAELLDEKEYKDFSAVKDALAAARALLEKADDLTEADQADIDAAAKALEDAIAALEKLGEGESKPTDKPAAGSGNPDDAPRTGDENHLIGLVLAALAFALCGSLAAVSVKRRKQHSNK